MASDESHISPEQLEPFLDGRLPDDDAASFVHHLGLCPACQRELESAAGGPGWWSDACRLLSPAAPVEFPHGHVRNVADDDLRLNDDERGAGLSLDFLAPTDDPSMLGRIGVYEVAGVIGRGGTGIVLKAFERSLNRFVAVKVLAPHLSASAAARKRFVREGQAAAAVVHEHIVPIYAVDEHQGLPYMVMRYIPGRSLQQRLERQGPLSILEVLRIGLQTATGLKAAHAHGLVHRDVKPANILLENGVERVMLTDFGLARTVDDASLTCSGVVAGTPQYMAPEQARGDTVDHRTDLFSLGSVLYAMCAGHSPFRAETTMGVLHRICTESPRPLRQINTDMPKWLEQIIRKLHARNPARRFQSADEVANLLAEHLARLQRPETDVRDTFWRRWPGPAIRLLLPRLSSPIMAAVALGVVAAIAVWNGFAGRSAVTLRDANTGVAPSAVLPQQGSRREPPDSAIAPKASFASTFAWTLQNAEIDRVLRDVMRLEQSVFESWNLPDNFWVSELHDLSARLSGLERVFRDSISNDGNQSRLSY